MRVPLRMMCLATVAMVAAAAVSAQDRWRRGPEPRSGACFYEHADFRGEYFCVRRGDNVAALADEMNDRISSIRIFGDTDAVVFEHARFGGDAARFSGDVRDLDREGWNDLISSLRVEARKWGGEARAPRWGRAAVPRDGACFYEDADFRGEYFCVPRGASYAELPAGFNDRISSIRLLGARVTIFQDANFSGRSDRLDADVQDMSRRWNDTISSFRVY